MTKQFRFLTLCLFCSCTASSLQAAVTVEKINELITQVQKGKNFDEAIKATQEAADSVDYDVSQAKKNLLKALLKNDTAFLDETIKSLQKKKGYDYETQETFRRLFSIGKGFEEAKKFAQEAMASNDEMSAIIILRLLVDYDKAIPEAIKVAQKTIKSDAYTKGLAFSLYRSLVTKGYAFAEATKVAQEAVSSPNPRDFADGIKLFGELVKKDQAINEALKIVQEKFKDEKADEALFYFLFELLAKNKAFDEATAIAKMYFASTIKGAQVFGFMIFDALVSKGRSIDDFITAARDSLKSPDFEKQNQALFILDSIFVENGQALNELSQMLKEVISSEKNAQIKKSEQALLEKIETAKKKAKTATPVPTPKKSASPKK